MNVTCHYCNTKLNIPDHKIPKDKNTAVTCPQCKEKIPIHPQKITRQVDEDKKSAPRVSFEDRRNALVCVGDDVAQKKVHNALKFMGFDIQSVKTADAALSKMEYRIYHMVILDETFDQNLGMSRVIKKMNIMDMYLRRRICLVLLSNRFQTNDNMATLHSSVNNILNVRDITHVESFLTRVILDHKNLYTVFNESLKLAGKA